MKNVPAEVKHIMSFAPKSDIATALVLVRERGRDDRKAVIDLEDRISEMVVALELLPENVTHQDVMERIYKLTGVMTDETDRESHLQTDRGTGPEGEVEGEK